jgi:hypothetical protein
VITLTVDQIRERHSRGELIPECRVEGPCDLRDCAGLCFTGDARFDGRVRFAGDAIFAGDEIVGALRRAS